MCGPVIGYFPDKHKSPENSDDEDHRMDLSDDEMLKREGRIVQMAVKRARERKRNANKLKAAAKNLHLSAFRSTIRTSLDAKGIGLQWTPFLVNTLIEVPTNSVPVTMSVQGVQARDEAIPKSLMERLDTIQQVFIFEAVNCDLQELPELFCKNLENLFVLNLSRNKISRLAKASLEIGPGKQSKLQELMVDANHLRVIEPGALANRTVASLMVLDLARNDLEILPLDFLAGADKLRFLDLSFNKLSVLPQSILQCTNLQVFHASNNALKALPELGELKELRKLFLSYNAIVAMPENIGNCQKLTKLRVTANLIRMMPRSAIKLWKRRGGMLEEMLIDGNPLLQPSITAYEMHGLDQCFVLFAEWINNEDAKETALEELQQELARAKMDEDVELVLPTNLARRGAGAMTTSPVIAARVASVQRALGRTIQAVGGSEEGQADPMDEGNGADEGIQNKNIRFYYSSFVGEKGAAAIETVRTLQSMLLFAKKKLFVESNQSLAEEATSYQGIVPRKELDTYFCLFVYATKPMYSSCLGMFMKFAVHTHEERPMQTSWSDEAPHLRRDDWLGFCKRAPIRIPEAIQDEMFRYVTTACSTQPRDVMTLETFIAAWQIHDIEVKDPWIRRIASVLKLEYFDMTVADLSREFAAKSASNDVAPASFITDLGHHRKDEGDGRQSQRVAVGLVPVGLKEEKLLCGPFSTREWHEEPGPDLKVSMSDMEYAIQQQRLADAENQSERSECEESDNLSIEEDTEDSVFDAKERLAEMARMEKERGLLNPGAKQVSTFAVQSDEDMRKLMELPVEQIGLEHHDSTSAQARATVISKQGKQVYRSKGRTKAKVHDPRFTTDMLNVRQAFREARRNLPLQHFTELIDYLLRAVRNIKFSSAEEATHWHCQDPVFSHLMRGGRYAESVLIDIGFVMVNETYWVWPRQHLHANAQQGDWGHLVIPPSCPGTQHGRLDDVLKLLTHVQKQIVKIREGQLFLES